MLDWETLIKEKATDYDRIALQSGLESGNAQQVRDDYKQLAKKLTHRCGIPIVDDRNKFTKRLRYAALNALHFGHGTRSINIILIYTNRRRSKLPLAGSNNSQKYRR